MEIENRLVISRVREEVKVDVTIQGQQEGILKMMKMFCILTVSMSVSWLCHWTIVFLFCVFSLSGFGIRVMGAL